MSRLINDTRHNEGFDLINGVTLDHMIKYSYDIIVKLNKLAEIKIKSNMI